MHYANLVRVVDCPQQLFNYFGSLSLRELFVLLDFLEQLTPWAQLGYYVKKSIILVRFLYLQYIGMILWSFWFNTSIYNISTSNLILVYTSLEGLDGIILTALIYPLLRWIAFRTSEVDPLPIGGFSRVYSLVMRPPF